MNEFYYIGASPFEEDCAQTTDPAFAEKNRRECEAYLDLLTRTFGPPPGNAYLAIKAQDHDFGTYREVVVYFDPESEEEEAYALTVEAGVPKWDAVALSKLGVS